MDFNKTPYFDDFDPEKNFYRVLFKPGQAVQARELNQLQSILQHQVSGVGKHLFRKNSVVIPGSVSVSSVADIITVTGLDDYSVIVGKTITNTGSYVVGDDTSLDTAVTALVVGYRNAVGTTAASLYVKYFKTDGSDGTTTTFAADQTLYTVEAASTELLVSSVSTGRIASVDAGTFFTKDVFVDSAKQTLIIESDSDTTTNCTIGFIVTESLITSTDDSSLLDNAVGSPNQYAPGADRYKIELTLTRVDAEDVITDDNFIILAKIENNVVTYLNNTSNYAEILNTLARRTYDANGNFIVGGLRTQLFETEESDTIGVNITNGKCYLGGYEYDQIADVQLTIDKPRSSSFQEEITGVKRYDHELPYFYVSGNVSSATVNGQLVQFLNIDTAQPSTLLGFAAATGPTAASGETGLDGTTDIITIPKHGLYDGDLLTYSTYNTAATGAIPGLVGATGYHVERIDADGFVLHSTFSSSLQGATSSVIDISNIEGTHFFKSDEQIKFTGYEYAERSFWGGSTGVSAASDTITFYSSDGDHGFQTGDRVYYISDGADHIAVGADSIADYYAYYVIRVSASAIKLAYTYSAARNGEAQALTAASSPTGDSKIRLMPVGPNLADHGSDAGEEGYITSRVLARSFYKYNTDGGGRFGPLRYKVSSGQQSDAIGGLTHGQLYWPASDNMVSGSAFRLTTSQIEAIKVTIRKAAGIQFTDAGATGVYHIFESSIMDNTATESVIGYGVSKGAHYHTGSSVSDPADDVYKMYFNNIFFEQGFSVGDVCAIKVIGETDIAAQVLHQIKIKNIVTDTNTEGETPPLFVNGNSIIPASTVTSGATGTEDWRLNSKFGTVYAHHNNYLYVTKPTEHDIPSFGSIKDIGTNTTAEIEEYNVSNFNLATKPMIEIDNNVVKTQKNSIGGVKYSIIKVSDLPISTASGAVQAAGIIYSGDTTITVAAVAGPDETVADYSINDYIFFIPPFDEYPYGRIVTAEPSNCTIEPSGKNVIIYVTPGGALDPNSYGATGLALIPSTAGGITMHSTVHKIAATPVSKSVSGATGTSITTPSSSWMSLDHQDIVELQKVVEGRSTVLDSAPAVTTPTSEIISLVFTYDSPTLATGDVIVVKGVSASGEAITDFNLGDEFFNREYTIGAGDAHVDNGDGTFTTTVTATLGATAAGSSDVTNSVVALPPIIATDTDITNRYILDSGSNPYSVGTGLIKQKKGTTTPAGQLGVQYTYYDVAIGTLDPGDYVNIDSYGNHTSGDLSYIGNVANAKSETNETIESRRYLDFRTTTSNYFFRNIGSIASYSSTVELCDLNLSNFNETLEGTWLVGPGFTQGVQIPVGAVSYNSATGNTKIDLSGATGPVPFEYNGTYFIGLGEDSSTSVAAARGRLYDFPRPEKAISYDYTRFTPREVLVYVSRDDNNLQIKYKDIASLDDVEAIRRDAYKLPLSYLFMKPYTIDISDVSVIEYKMPVYQMADIHNLADRIGRNEYYTSLALSGAPVNDDSEEKGFWVENFLTSSNQAFESPDFAATVHDQSYVSPGVITNTINLVLDESENASTWKRTGNSVTLPYTEAKVISNSVASRGNNLNPHGNVQWGSGKVELFPATDNWCDPGDVVPGEPPYCEPIPRVEEYVTKISNLRTNLSPDSSGGDHGISFDWELNTGRTGTVNTDAHLSSVVFSLGAPAWNGEYAESLINKRLKDVIASDVKVYGLRDKFGRKKDIIKTLKGVRDIKVKEYLNAGTHFEEKPPKEWKRERRS